MKQKKQILKAEKTLSMSKKTRERILTIAKDIKGKELFPNVPVETSLARIRLLREKHLP